MNDLPSEADHPTCPKCGSPLDIWPTLDGSGTIALCPQCSRGPTPISPRTRPIPQTEPEPQRDSRLKNLLHEASSQDSSPEEFNNLLEDLDPSARDLLQRRIQKTTPEQAENLSEDSAQSLRYQGYTVHEDSGGLRIGGSPRSSNISSPYEIVRMAAELDGGLKPDAERIQCPKCEAVLPSGATKCQWCGEIIPPSKDASIPEKNS